MAPFVRMPRRQAVVSQTLDSDMMKRIRESDSITFIEAIQKQNDDEDEHCLNPTRDFLSSTEAVDIDLGASKSLSAPMPRTVSSFDKLKSFITSDRSPDLGQNKHKWISNANVVRRWRGLSSNKVLSNNLEIPTIAEDNQFDLGPEERDIIHSPVNGDTQKMSLRGRVSLDEGKCEECGDCLMHLADIRRSKLTLEDVKQDSISEEQEENCELRYTSFGQQWRTVIFIRHGQSEWNLAKKKAGTAKASAVVRGVYEFMADKKDAVIADSPLSKEGIQQAKELHDFIEQNRRKTVIIPRDDFLRSELLLNKMAYMKSAIEHSVKLLRKELHRESISEQEDISPVPEVLQNLEECKRTLKDVDWNESLRTMTKVNEITIPTGSPLNNPHNIQKYDIIDHMASANNYSVLCASNLRRAVATMVIALWTRLKTDKDEKVQILSCLQEIGRNMDTKSLAPVNAAPKMSKLERGTSILVHERDDMENIYKHQLDTSMNFGDKSTACEKSRLTEFAEFCFRNRKPIVVTCGHSGWFKYFFNRFLPSHSNHIVKRRKLDNCSMLAFSLSWLPELGKSNPGAYYICPNSVKLLFGKYKPEM